MQVLAKTRTIWVTLVLCSGCLFAPVADARDSIFDNVLCRAFGCVILHNTHDAVVYLTAGAENSPAIEWQRNAVSPITTVEQGSREVVTAPTSGQSSFVGFDRDGDGLTDNRFDDVNETGYLDAGDTIEREKLQSRTRLSVDQVSAGTAFFVAANSAYGLRAKAVVENRSGDLGADYGDFSDYALAYSYARNGSVANVRYGRFTRNAFCAVSNDIRSLEDVAPQARTIFRCARRSVVYNNARSDLMDFSSMLTTDYSLKNGYDLSMGTGEVVFSLTIDVVN